MHLPPKQLAFRLVLWSGLLAWAMWKMNRTGVEESMAPDVRELAAPASVPLPATLAPPVVDPGALVQALEAASAVAARCGATGATVTVRLGPAGLGGVTLRGRVTDAVAECLRQGIWALEWPRGGQELETSAVL